MPVKLVSHPRHPLTGKQFSITAKTERELAARLDHLDRLRRDLRDGLSTPDQVDRVLRRLRHGSITLERAVRSYVVCGIAPNTARNVRGLLDTHFAELAGDELDALDGARLSRWVEKLRAKLQPSTITWAWRTLRAIVRHAHERGWIARSPWGTWRPRLRSPKTSTREAARDVLELARLLAGARHVDARKLARGRLGDVTAKIAAAAFLGLRQGELAGLRWTDVDAIVMAVLIARQYEGGPTKQRTVDVVRAVPELFTILDEHRAALERFYLYDPKGPVFPCVRHSIPGRMVAPYQGRAEALTRAELRAAVLAAGLPHPERWSAHSLRDTFVTLENDASGGDLAAVAARSRHASVGSLVRYLRARTREAPAPMMQLPTVNVPKQLT